MGIYICQVTECRRLTYTKSNSFTIHFNWLKDHNMAIKDLGIPLAIHILYQVIALFLTELMEGDDSG